MVDIYAGVHWGDKNKTKNTTATMQCKWSAFAFGCADFSENIQNGIPWY